MVKFKPKKRPAKKTATKKRPQKKVGSTRRSRRLIKKLGPAEGKRTYDLSVASHAFLKGKLKVKSFAEVFAEACETRIAQELVRASHEKYHSAISLALALYYSVLADLHPDDRLKQLTKASGYHPSARSSPAQIVVHAVINYGKTAKEKTIGRKFACRDAAAIEHLAQRGISPDEVVTLGKKKGEGLEAWARTKPRTRLPERPSDLRGKPYDDWDEPENAEKEQENEDQEQEDEGQEDQESDEDNWLNKEIIEDDADPFKMSPETIRFIRSLAKVGPMFGRAEGEEAVWVAMALKLNTSTRTYGETLVSLAKALQEVAPQLIERAS